MKKLLMIIAILYIAALGSMAQPQHPNGGVGPGTGNTPVGGGAPLDGGTGVLAVMAVAWAMKKSFSNNQKR